MKLVYEVNGKDVFDFEFSPKSQGPSLPLVLMGAKHEAKKLGVPLSDVTLRFVDDSNEAVESKKSASVCLPYEEDNLLSSWDE